jgi:hypothetical protein
MSVTPRRLKVIGHFISDSLTATIADAEGFYENHTGRWQLSPRGIEYLDMIEDLTKCERILGALGDARLHRPNRTSTPFGDALRGKGRS